MPENTARMCLIGFGIWIDRNGSKKRRQTLSLSFALSALSKLTNKNKQILPIFSFESFGSLTNCQIISNGREKKTRMNAVNECKKEEKHVNFFRKFVRFVSFSFPTSEFRVSDRKLLEFVERSACNLPIHWANHSITHETCNKSALWCTSSLDHGMFAVLQT